MQGSPTLSSLVVHDHPSQDFLKVFIWGIDRYPRRVLHFEFWSSPCLFSLKISHYLLFENGRGSLGENTTYILRTIHVQAPHILQHRVWVPDFRKFYTFFGANFLGVVSHIFPVVPPVDMVSTSSQITSTPTSSEISSEISASCMKTCHITVHMSN